MRRKLVIVDLMCGAGGFSTAAINALLEMGYTLDQIVLAALNHWKVAIDTHSVNLPYARHYLQDIAIARPHIIVPEGYVDLFLASPTCTHHSVARGGKPTSDQQRADPWHLIPWFTELRVKRAMVENVWEFTSWGPVDPRTGRPVKARKGEFHRAWIDTIWKLGATSIEWKKLNSANYGGATTRVRYVNKIRFDKVQVGWAPRTHAKCEEGGNLELFPTLQPWRAAREIIDWTKKGKSIFGRPKPLAPKTFARILAGAIKFEWPRPYRIRIAEELKRSLRYYIAESFRKRHARKKDIRVRARKKVIEYIDWLRSIESGQPDVKGEASSAHPIVVTLRNNVVARSTGSPVPALVAGGNHVGIAQPFMLSTGSTGAPRSTDEPTPTATTGGAGADARPGCARTMLVEPFILSRHGEGYGATRAHSTKEPMPTLTCAKRGELAFITAQFGEREGQAPRVHDVALPAPTPTATGHIDLVEGIEDYDVLFRMFEVDELARAMGLDNHVFTGTKTEQIKQIGNAVEERMMRAEIKAIMADAPPKTCQRSTIPAAIAAQHRSAS